MQDLTIVLVIFRIMRPSKSCAETEIGELYVAHFINQDIIRFNVPVDKAHLVDAVHCADKLAYVKPKKG